MRGIKKKLVVLASILALLTSALPVWAEESGQQEAKEELYDGLDPEAVILTVGEDKVPLKKAYFLIKFQQSIVQDMQKGVYGSLWYKLPLYKGDRSFQDNMKESVMNLLVRMSLARQHQEEYGVSVSKGEQEKIDAAVKLFFESNSEEALQAMMADEETVKEVLTDYTLLSKVIAKVIQNTKVEYGEAKTYSYVYGSFGEDAGSVSSDLSASSERLVEDFNNIRSRALSGGLDQAAAESGYPTALHTYFIEDENDSLAEFNQIMEGLEKGEVSEVTHIGTNQGLFIGCLQEVDEESLEAARQSLQRSEQLKVLRKTTKQWVAESKTAIDEAVWEQVTMARAISAYRRQTEE